MDGYIKGTGITYGNLRRLCGEVSSDTGIQAEYIEKDFYVTRFLRRLAEAEPRLIFKGGTSLSKCHKAINRFSEDIDINLAGGPTGPSEASKRNFKNLVRKTGEEDLGLVLENPDEIRSKRKFNRYVFSYDSCLAGGGKETLVIETAMQAPSFPNASKTAGSYLGDFLIRRGAVLSLADVDLVPFEVTAQSLERTFIDKTFAVADYYMAGKSYKLSRHIYDLYRILPHITINDELRGLVQEIRKLRRDGYQCFSAADGVDILKIFREIKETEYYREDYEKVTVANFYPGENLDYDAAAAIFDVLTGLFNKPGGGPAKKPCEPGPPAAPAVQAASAGPPASLKLEAPSIPAPSGTEKDEGQDGPGAAEAAGKKAEEPRAEQGGGAGGQEL